MNNSTHAITSDADQVLDNTDICIIRLSGQEPDKRLLDLYGNHEVFGQCSLNITVADIKIFNRDIDIIILSKHAQIRDNKDNWGVDSRFPNILYMMGTLYSKEVSITTLWASFIYRILFKRDMPTLSNVCKFNTKLRWLPNLADVMICLTRMSEFRDTNITRLDVAKCSDRLQDRTVSADESKHTENKTIADESKHTPYKWTCAVPRELIDIPPGVKSIKIPLSDKPCQFMLVNELGYSQKFTSSDLSMIHKGHPVVPYVWLGIPPTYTVAFTHTYSYKFSTVQQPYYRIVDKLDILLPCDYLLLKDGKFVPLSYNSNIKKHSLSIMEKCVVIVDYKTD